MESEEEEVVQMVEEVREVKGEVEVRDVLVEEEKVEMKVVLVVEEEVQVDKVVEDVLPATNKQQQ